ncbi:hypothetical protein BDM02DRAFT_3085719 [Thelephora ganbajun]|uniref:Uncharacterized protein n=1 Tax=Thelephora ganbajun TaxID=370292 RepID=A0ACB6ZXK5_THEGA|nr:hypothetical protein BDM02DRAFT_3085719 [Thelephora ganbajun]
MPSGISNILPSVLKARPALQDETTTPQQLKPGIARVTTPEETKIFICKLDDCNRLFPSKERLMAHRKRDHGSGEEGEIISWNL